MSINPTEAYACNRKTYSSRRRRKAAAARFSRPKLSFNEIGKQFYKSNAHRESAENQSFLN